MDSHEIYIQRCFDLAINGLGKVVPNPLVGSVIVKNGQIIGEGWHQKFGGPHAEVEAIRSVENQQALEGATIYVNLEPCSHFGKTPPCADLLIEKKIGKVICSNSDPNPLVSGNGFAKLRSAGIEVVENVLVEKGRWLNRRFFTFQEKKRPYIILKWAETADGFVARADFSSKWISSEISRTLVHKWRTEESAILVGYQTALHDNPTLTARDWPGSNPVRCVIDRYSKLPEIFNLFNNDANTLIFNSIKNSVSNETEWVKIDFDQPVLPQLMQKLAEKNIQSVIVEGGSFTLLSFLESGIWDEARVFKSKSIFANGIKAPQPKGNLISRDYIAEDELSFYVNSNV